MVVPDPRSGPYALYTISDLAQSSTEMQLSIFKKKDILEAKTQLKELRGKTHQLISALCVFKNKEMDWHCINISNLKMRSFSDPFLESYVNKAGEALFCPGAYQLEGLGPLLFDNIDGDYFSILGLPLISLLEYLRKRGVIQT